MPKPPPVDRTKREEERRARHAMPGHAEQHGHLIEHQHHRRKLERVIRHAGQIQRVRGPLTTQDAAKLKKARTDLDALNESIHQQRRKMKLV